LTPLSIEKLTTLLIQNIKHTMTNLKDKIVRRLPSIIATESGFLKLNEEQKEALARRLEMFFQIELASAHEEGKINERKQLPTISLN